MTRDVPDHWLRANHTVWTPRRIVCFDTETHEKPDGTDLVLTLRCWCAAVITRGYKEEGAGDWDWHDGTSCTSLAILIDKVTKSRSQTWVYAHNLHFDLAVTALPEHLATLGYVTKTMHVGSANAFFVMVRGDKKIVITDSFSWLPHSLATIGEAIGREKVDLPTDDADLEAWLARCRRDVEILGHAMCDVMAWWDRERLGKWALTGAGCGWAAMRHKPMHPKILVTNDPERRAFERSAIYGGRREVFNVGTATGAQWADWDFTAAYPTAALHLEIPTKATKVFDTERQLDLYLHAPGHSAIAAVEIRTELPCVPAKVAGDVFWPVGRFRTTLCGPEILLAARMGASVTLLHGQAYRTARPIRAWAAWLLALQAGVGSDHPLLARMLAKSWGRSVLGRFATWSSEVVEERPSLHPSWHLETGWSSVSQSRCDWVSIGGKTRVITKDREPPEAFPAIWAFIESHVRAALTVTMAARDGDRLWQCNTDGFIERVGQLPPRWDVPAAPEPFQARLKGTYTSVRMVGPNHVTLDDQRRYSGIPRDATEPEPERFQFRSWPTLRYQLRASEPESYRRREVTVTIDTHFCRRWVLNDGTTEPVRMTVGAKGANELVPFTSSYPWHSPDALYDIQHPALIPLAF